MRYLRGAVSMLGLAVLGLFGLVELVLRRRDASAATPAVDVVAAPPAPPVSRRLSRIRVVVGALGVALAGYGVYLVVGTVPVTSYLAIALWLAAAVVLHDAVLVPAVSVLRAITLRAGRRLPAASLALVEGAFVVGGVLTLIAVPEIWAQQLGPLNPSVLPGSYGQALLVTWVVLVGLVVGSVGVGSLLGRRRSASPSGLVH